MSCADCFDLCELVKGQNTERIGAIANLSDTVLVWFHNLGSDRWEAESVTTDGSGNVDVPLTADWLMHGQRYEITITPAVYSSVEIDITPQGETDTYSCLRFTLVDKCEP